MEAKTRPKRETIPDWEVAGATGKKTSIQGLFSAATEQVDLCTHIPESFKVFMRSLIGSVISQSRCTNNTLLSQDCVLENDSGFGKGGQKLYIYIYIYTKDRGGGEEIPIASNWVQASKSLCSPIFEHNFQQVP